MATKTRKIASVRKGDIYETNSGQLIEVTNGRLRDDGEQGSSFDGRTINFNLETGHFIPALIRKFSEHKILGKPIVMWGTGNPEREFTFADDIARIIMKALKFYNSEEPLNIGNPKNYRIREVVEMMASIAEVDASLIQWDLMMPDGQMKKPTKVDLKEIGWHNNDFTSLEDGLRETWLWFLKETSSRIRGIE